MDDLVAFLRARLDEDERIARATLWDDDGSLGSNHWHAFDRGPHDGWTQARWVVIDGADEGVVISRPQAADDEAVIRHIARHDPARVLREIEAKRQLVKLHGRATLRAGGGAQYFDTTIVCRTCEPSYQFPEMSWPCSTLRLLALPYADHPDYRESWRP